MSDSMIDRIAHIIQETIRGDAPIGLDACRDAARRAVDAMRQPTSAMTKAGSDIPIGCCMTNASDAGEVWEYMIDAARSERL